MRSPSQWPASPRVSTVFGRSWIEARSLMVSRESLARRGRRRLCRRVRYRHKGLGLLGSPIDEGVDCLAADGPQPWFVAGLQPTGDLARASILRRGDHEQSRAGPPLVGGSLHAACAVDRLRRREAANTHPRGVRSAAAPWRWWLSPDRAPGRWRPPTAQRRAKYRSRLFRPPTDADRIAWQHSLGCSNNLADIKLPGGVALGLGTQGQIPGGMQQRRHADR